MDVCFVSSFNFQGDDHDSNTWTSSLAGSGVVFEEREKTTLKSEMKVEMFVRCEEIMCPVVLFMVHDDCWHK